MRSKSYEKMKNRLSNEFLLYIYRPMVIQKLKQQKCLGSIKHW